MVVATDPGNVKRHIHILHQDVLAAAVKKNPVVPYAAQVRLHVKAVSNYVAS